MKKFIVYFLTVMLLATFININAVSEEKEMNNSEIIYENGAVPHTDKNIKYIGRWIDTGKSMVGTFEGYAELKFTGNYIQVLSDEVKTVHISYDGKAPETVKSNVKKTFENSGEHTIRIYQFAQLCNFSIKGFEIGKNEKTLKGEEKPVIEFVGDSITEGYVGKEGDTPPNNSYLNSFAYKTGIKLNCDFNTVAFGGIRLLNGGNPDKMAMAERYFKAGEYGTKYENIAWDTKKYVPDCIVINMGTNDNVNEALFQLAYMDYINKISGNYSNTKIFLMTPFNGKYNEAIKNAINGVKNENIYHIDTASWEIKNGDDNIHPTVSEQERASELLAEYFNEKVFSTPAPTPTPTPTETPSPTTPNEQGNNKTVLTVSICSVAALLIAGGIIIKKKK